MRNSVSIHTRGSDLLFIIACMFCTLYIFMRVLTAGVEVAVPEDFLLGALALAGAVSAIVSRLLCNGLILPQKRALIAVMVYICCVFAAFLSAYIFNYQYTAQRMGVVWIGDILIFIAVVITARDRNVFRLYISALGSSIVMVGVYALYQKVYAISYLQSIAKNSGVFKENLRAKGMAVAQAFIFRLEDGWVGGGFGSETALCAFALLFTFFILGIRKNRDGLIFDVALFFGLVVIIVSGSWYGLLLAKVAEVFVLYKLVNNKQSTIKKVLLVVGGVGIVSVLSAFVAVGFWVATEGIVAQLVLSLLWYAEIEFLKGRYNNNESKEFEYLVGIAFFMVITFFGLAINIAGSESDLGVFRTLCEHGIKENFPEIFAAWDAFMASPIIGWGLDNFSEVHAIYKQSGGPQLGRAGNLYLELLADGGVFFLLSFLWLVIVVFFAGKVERREHHEIESPVEKYEKLGVYGIVGSFLLCYFFVLLGVFDRMGVDYFLMEFSARPESFLARGAGIAPLIWHCIVNFIILPFSAVLAFKKCWAINIEYVDITYYIKISILIFLLYAFFGAYLYHTALSGFFWVMLGLLLAREQAWGLLNIRSKVRNIIAYVVLILGVIWGTWGVWSGFVRSNSEREVLRLAGVYKEQKDLDIALHATEKAIMLSELNADLLIQKANFLLQRINGQKFTQGDKEFTVIIDTINKAIALRPYASEYYVLLAGVLSRYADTDNHKLIEESFKKAEELYPLNAKYVFLHAEYLQDQGRIKEAAEYARKAIELSMLYADDYTVGLRRYELFKARNIAYQTIQ